RSGRQRARKRWEWCAFSEAAPLWWVWCSKEGDQAIARRVPSRNVASTPRRQVAHRIGVELEARGQMLSTINSTNPTPTNSTAKRHRIVFEPMPIFGKHDVNPYSNTWVSKDTTVCSCRTFHEVKKAPASLSNRGFRSAQS